MSEPVPDSPDQDNLQLLFPTVLQVSEVADHQRINAALCNEIGALRQTTPNTKPQSWACDVYTTIGDPRILLQRPATREFLDIARDKVMKFARALSFDVERQPPNIHECWFNVYASNQSQEIHLHRNSVISGIYYVQAPAGSGATLFYSPLSDVMLEPRATEGNKLTAKVTGFPPVEGRMLLFRSSLRHSVLPGEVDGERITIAFNVVM